MDKFIDLTNIVILEPALRSKSMRDLEAAGPIGQAIAGHIRARAELWAQIEQLVVDVHAVKMGDFVFTKVIDGTLYRIRLDSSDANQKAGKIQA